MALVFGRVPHPAYVDRLIPDSETNAWNDLGPRVIVGSCQHSMVGSLVGTDRWFRRSTKGSDPDGLTDYGIGGSADGPDLDGVIYRWNDPRGRRAPWANGGVNGMEGDGPLFVRTLGVNAVNRDLVSIERSDGGNINTPLSPKQFESMCQLHAYWADQAKIPWTDFPKNPKVGIVTDMEHFEFALKDCPFPPVKTTINAQQTRIREILRQYQGEVVTQPDPAPTPDPIPTPTPDPTPDPTPTPTDQWPNGWTTAELSARFGKMVTLDLTKSPMVTKASGFYEKGLISNAWVGRAVTEGITESSRIPTATYHAVTQSKDGVKSELITFPRSGYPDWVLFIGDGNAGGRWIQ